MAAALANRPLICAVSATKELVTAIKQKSSELVIKEVLVPLPHSIDKALEEVRQCEILIAGNDIISKVLENPGKLKWVQSTWAGLDNILSQYKQPPGVILTRNGHGYGQLMTEFVVGHIISRERDFHNLMTAQKQKQWKWDAVDKIRPLTSVSIGVLGIGEIGKRVCQMCHSLGMKVYGMTRTPVSSDRKEEYVHEYRLMSDLQDFLQNCDYICNVLPGTPETIGLLNGEVLKHCQPKKSIFINIGRGSVIAEEDLLTALRCGWIGGAVLDVFEKEPLPTDSPLWSEPGVIITPHCAGPTVTLLTAEAFLMNYKRYMEGQDLLWKYDFTKGY